MFSYKSQVQSNLHAWNPRGTFYYNLVLPISIEVANVRGFLSGLREFINTTKPNFREIINSTKTFTSEAESILKDAILEYKKTYTK